MTLSHNTEIKQPITKEEKVKTSKTEDTISWAMRVSCCLSIQPVKKYVNLSSSWAQIAGKKPIQIPEPKYVLKITPVIFRKKCITFGCNQGVLHKHQKWCSECFSLRCERYTMKDQKETKRNLKQESDRKRRQESHKRQLEARKNEKCQKRFEYEWSSDILHRLFISLGGVKTIDEFKKILNSSGLFTYMPKSGEIKTGSGHTKSVYHGVRLKRDHSFDEELIGKTGITISTSSSCCHSTKNCVSDLRNLLKHQDTLSKKGVIPPPEKWWSTKCPEQYICSEIGCPFCH